MGRLPVGRRRLFWKEIDPTRLQLQVHVPRFEEQAEKETRGVAFAFCYLLGSVRLMPRLKRIKYERLYLPDKEQLESIPIWPAHLRVPFDGSCSNSNMTRWSRRRWR